MEAQARLKILTYNIHKGFSISNRKFVLHEMREAVSCVQADLIFLQEVLGEHQRHQKRRKDWPSNSQFEFLAQEIWPHFAYGPNKVHSLGHHGNAILSKYPIAEWRNIDISTNLFERRGLLHAVVNCEFAAESIHAICLHLNLSNKGRLAQVREVCEFVAREVPGTAPLIIAGDLNDWSEKASKILTETLEVTEVYHHIHGRHAKTFPSVFPFLKLDRLYCRGFQIHSAELLSREHWKRLSDHAPIVADLSLTR